MRIRGIAYALMLTGLTAWAAPAHANWSCQGSEFVCGAAKSTSSSSQKKIASAPKKQRTYSSNSASTDGGSYSGKASYYWQPQRLASGGWFNPNAYTAAHKTLPFGTKVRVTNRNNGASVVVTINDRGPYVAGRVIDLSRAAAKAISMTGAGVVPVSVTVLGRG